ncbi:formate dehydrogenase, partial [Malaciobacter mytili LMG 24559]
GAFGTKGAMDKCTMCAGGPLETNSSEERHLYGQNRIAEGKVPVCAAMCSTKALLVGDAQEVSKIYRERVLSRGHGVQTSPMTWSRAYGAK